MFEKYKWEDGILYYQIEPNGLWIKKSPDETITYLKNCMREIAMDFYENDKGECCSDIGSKGVLRMIGE